MTESGPPITSDSPRPNGGRLGILVVEDSENTRRPLAELLHIYGYTVYEAAHGREALDLLERTPTAVRVILLDLAMPVMDGWHFRQAQLQNPVVAAIPVVAFTVAPPDEVMRQALQADVYLQKPVTFDDLMDAITRLVASPDADTDG